jgi:putative transposase
VKHHGQRTPFWQAESFDHIVRDGFEFDRTVRYILDNPRKAGLVDWPHVFVKSD